MRKMETFLFVVAFSMFLCAFAPTATAGWMTETVDDTDYTGYYSSLFFDSSGHQHFAYGAFISNIDTLVYSEWNGTGYVREVISSDMIIHDSYTISAVWDSSEYAHITYMLSSSNTLVHTYYDGTGWTIENIESIDARYVSMSINTLDELHISYLDNTNDRLKYATKTLPSGSWQIEEVSTGGNYYRTSITTDSGGIPHIAYIHKVPGSSPYTYNVAYAERSGSSWNLITIAENVYQDGAVSITTDTNNYPHIVFIDDSTQCVNYANKAGGVWTTEYLHEHSSFDYVLEIILDGSNNPHIIYLSNTDYLAYDSKSGSVWSSENIAAAGEYGVSGAFYSGDLYVAYQEYGRGALKYAGPNNPSTTPTPTPTITPSPSPTATATPTVTPTPNFTNYGSVWHFFWYVPFFEVEQAGAFPFIKAADGTLIESCSVPEGECVLDSNYVNAIYVIYTESRDDLWVGIRNFGITITNADGTVGDAKMRLFIINLAAYIPLTESLHADWVVDGNSLWNLVFKYKTDTLSGIRAWWVIIFALMVVTWLVAGRKWVHPQHPKKRKR